MGSVTGVSPKRRMSTSGRSACSPASIDPMRSSSPTARAEPMVASASASGACITSGLSARIRATATHERIGAKGTGRLPVIHLYRSMPARNALWQVHYRDRPPSQRPEVVERDDRSRSKKYEKQ